MSIYKKFDNKQALRKQHNDAVTEFLAQGNSITKCPTYKTTPKKKQEVKVVEIEVDFLPKALQDKFFKGE
jgi:hypothetical protein